VSLAHRTVVHLDDLRKAVLPSELRVRVAAFKIMI
jgi:hypothetical protein